MIFPKFAILLCCAAAAGHSASLKPNIILMMTDDQGYGDLGITGNPIVQTPHIDALARGGASMTHFYVSPVCSPTRASLMTGRYNYRTRVVDTFKGRSMLEGEEVTIAEALRDAGYATGIFGKWHLGDNYPLRPTDQGFTEALVLRGGGLAQSSDPIENGNRYTNPILFHNDRQIQATGYCTDIFFDGAMEFIGAAQRDGRPFFVYIAPNAPHGPFHDVPAALYEKYRVKDLTSVLMGNVKDADTVARVYAMVENIDDNVGRLIARLKEHRLLDNTLVVFMCDNGPASVRYVGPMRGKKNEVHEGGIRSPFFAHWPARLTPGTTSDRIAAHIDVMPTLLAAAGVARGSTSRLDGRSILPLLEGRTVGWDDRTIVLQSHRGDRPVPLHHIAVRTQQWKLVHPTGFLNETPSQAVPFELYDMSSDAKEQRNLAELRPDVYRRLYDAYHNWFADVSSTRTDNFAAPRIVIGSKRETITVLTRQDWRDSDSARYGKWLLRAERDAEYDVELRWLKPVTAGTIEITAGALVRTMELSKPVDRVRFDRIRIPSGDLEFTAVLRRANVTDGPYQATLAQVAAAR